MLKNYFIVVLLCIACSITSYGQTSKFKVITTEISRGTVPGKEYIELFVDGIKTCSEDSTIKSDSIADLSRMLIYDPNGRQYYTNKGDTIPGIASGKYYFPESSFPHEYVWDSIPYGTVILIYNDKNKNNAITFADDSTGTIRANTRVIPVSWLKNIDSTPPVIPIKDTILYSPAALNLQDFHNIFLVEPLLPPYINTTSLWRDSLLDGGTQSPGFCTTESICDWWASRRKSALEGLCVSLKVQPSDTSIKYCPNTKLSFCGIVTCNISPTDLSYQWYVNDTLIANYTSACLDTFLKKDDSVRLNVSTTLRCRIPQTLNLKYTAVNIYPDGGIIKTLVKYDGFINKPTIDSLGTDTLGVSDTTRYYVNYCKGSFVKLAPVPHAFGAPASGPSDNFVWFSKLKGKGVSFDSCYVDSSLKSSDTLLCIHTTSIPCVKNPIDTTFIFLTALDSLAPPKIVISTSDTNVCSTDTICFTATLTPTTLSDTTVKYGIRWMHNLDSLAPLMIIDTIYAGNDLIYCFPSTLNSTYLRDLDSIRAVLYTNKTNTCPIDTTTISNTITMHVTQTIIPSVTIKASQEYLCPNPPYSDTITFTADTTNLVAGIKPILWWTKNDVVLLGVTGILYIDSATIKPDDVVCVHVRDTSDKCARPDTAKACKQMVLGPVVPAGNVTQDPLNICEGFGTSVTFTANPTNFGISPIYKWELHPAGVGQPVTDVTPTGNPLVYVNTTPVNLDTVVFIMKSSVGCADPNPITESFVINVQSSVTPSVKISADSDTLCFNTTTTVSPNPTNGGPTPIYEWYLNGISQSLGATYTYTGSTTGDYVYCKLTSSAPCALVKDVFSDTVYFTVNPLPIVPPILPDPTSVCVGASKQLTNTASGGTWASSNSSILVINPTTGNITGVSAGNTNVSYSLTDANNCTASSTLSVEVLPTTVPPLTGKSNICVGEATLITNGIPATNWVSDNTSVAEIQPTTGVVIGKANGTAILTYTLTNFCGTTLLTFPINVGVPPLPTISGQNVLCNINDNTTLQSTTLGGTWTSSDPTVAQIDPNNGVVTAKGFGTTNITYSVTNDCGTTPATLLFTVGSPLVNEIQGVNTICTGFFTQLTNTTAGGTWSSSNPSIATVDLITDPGKVEGLSSGNVTISYTVTNSCGTTVKNFAITVQNGPPVNAIIVPDSIICINQTTTLSHPTSGGLWTSSNSAIAEVDPASGTVTGKTNGDVEISYTLNNGCGKVVVKTNIHVGSPIIGAYTFKNPICVNEVTTITNDTKGATTYLWISLNQGVATFIPPVIGQIVGVAAGNASIFYIATNKCGATNDNSAVLTVIGLPKIAAIKGKDSLCVNEASIYTNDTTKGVWALSDTNIAKIDSVTGLVTAIQSGIDTVKYTVVNSNGCSNTVVKAIILNALPVIQPIAGKLNACFNRTTLLTNPTPNGLWSSSIPAIADFQDKTIGSLYGFVNGVTKVTYTVVNQFGCINKVDTTIAVNPIPNVDSIKGVDSVCVNSSIVLTNATKGGVWTATPSSIATMSQDIVTGNGIIKGLTNGIATAYYTVTVLGCDSIASFKVKVDTNNVAEIVGANIICVGGTTQLTNATMGGVGTWINTNNGNSFVDSNLGIVTGVKNGLDTIKYSYKNNCGITVKTFPMTIGKPPVQPIIGRDSICVGTSVVLTNPTSGGIWTNDSLSLLMVDLGSGKITAMKAGLDSVRYTVTGIGGCSTVVAKAIRVIDLPNVNVTPLLKDICKGDSLQFASSPIGGVWTSVNTSIATVDANGFVKGVAPGSTQINYVYTDVLTTCINSGFSKVNIIAPPVIGNITYGNNDSTKLHVGLTLQLSDTTIGGIWSTSQPIIANVDNFGKVTALAVGQSDIFYKVANSIGCVDSAKITITVLNQLNDLYIPNYLYPLSTNVDNKKFKIYGKFINSLKLKIFSQWGQLIYETNDKDGSGWDGTFKGKEQPVGVYVYVAEIVLKSGETITKKGAVNLIR